MNLDRTERKAAIRIAGLFVAAVAVFAILSTTSFLFHWQEDMSVVSSNHDKAANICGRAGAIFGDFLFSKALGFGAYAIIAVLIQGAIALFIPRWTRSYTKFTILAVSAAFLVSILSACAGLVGGFPQIFGRGPGGAFGTMAACWSVALMGLTMTCVAALLLLIIWLFFCSYRFKSKLATLGDHNDVESEEVSDMSGSDAQRGLEKSGTADERQAAASRGEDCLSASRDGFQAVQREFRSPADASEGAAFRSGAASGIDCQTQPGLEERTDREGGNVTTSDNGVPPEAELPDPENSGDDEFTIVEDAGLSTEIEKPLEPINNRLDPPDGLPRYKFPPKLDLLNSYEAGRHEVPKDELIANKEKIKTTLANYKIQIVKVEAIVGSTVTLYKVYPAPGVQIAQIRRLQEDIGISLNAKGVRVSTLSDSVGIEVANKKASIVPIRALLNDDAFRNSKADLPVAIGYTIQQQVKVFDLADAPHLLIAGATKQGKSVGLNIIINSLLYSKHPSELKFVFIDPKMVEFTAYSKLLHHYLAVLPSESEEEEIKNAIVKKAKDAEIILKSLCVEMDNRYNLFTTAGNGVNNIKVYNDRYKNRKLNPEKGHKYLPYLVVIVDEYADLTMTLGASMEVKNSSRSITNSIIRLAQKGRAAGIHVILATQRPSVDVINGVIKSNFPMRIAFRVASRIDSQTILDSPGAERLIGNGDMLLSASIESERIQCGYISGEEINQVCDFVSEQTGYAKSYNTPYYLPVPEETPEDQDGMGGGEMGRIDDRFEEAARMVVMSQRGSTSDLQRKLGMGYSRAGKVMDQLEVAGIVGPQEGSKPRQVLVSDFDSLQEILDRYI